MSEHDRDVSERGLSLVPEWYVTETVIYHPPKLARRGSSAGIPRITGSRLEAARPARRRRVGPAGMRTVGCGCPVLAAASVLGKATGTMLLWSVPYTVEQDETGWWCAHAPLPGGGANGEGQTPEEAVADLRQALDGWFAEFGVPEELTVTVPDVA